MVYIIYILSLYTASILSRARTFPINPNGLMNFGRQSRSALSMADFGRALASLQTGQSSNRNRQDWAPDDGDISLGQRQIPRYGPSVTPNDSTALVRAGLLPGSGGTAQNAPDTENVNDLVAKAVSGQSAIERPSSQNAPSPAQSAPANINDQVAAASAGIPLPPLPPQNGPSDVAVLVGPENTAFVENTAEGTTPILNDPQYRAKPLPTREPIRLPGFGFG